MVVEKCLGKPFGFGYNAATNVFEDLVAAGILDPAKVIPSPQVARFFFLEIKNKINKKVESVI